MLNFSKLTEEALIRLKPWFSEQNTHIADYSLGFQFMWHSHLGLHFAIFGDCLIFREVFAGKTYFYYPLSKNGDAAQTEEAICEIEAYCRNEGIRMHFTNVPRAALPALVLRYGREVTVTDSRRWRDYLYNAEDFKTYAGGKFSGQRNHVHKFTKKYPDWRFRVCTADDLPAIEAFLREYEVTQREKHAYLADTEMDEVYAFLPKMARFGILFGVLEVREAEEAGESVGKPQAAGLEQTGAEGAEAGSAKIVAFAAGERCGDMLIVHIEKALRAYEGAYPTVAQAFARAFCGEGVRYINRMDDAGDGGLRKSKLQYCPCELVDKYNLAPRRAIDEISRLPVLRTERLRLAPLGDADTAAYARLASDVERNRYWGYDWRTDCDGTPPDSYFIACAREEFKCRREFSLGIYENKRLVGEVVLHRFGYRDEAEVGVRLLPEEEGKGYAREAVRAVARYAFLTLSIAVLEAKCYRENVRSRATLEGAGMRECGRDETFYYFRLTPEM